MRPATLWTLVLIAGISAVVAAPLRAENATPLAGTAMVETSHDYDALIQRIKDAIAAHEMGLVATASASAGAAARGVQIPGNAVLMVFRNDFAVRMLEASTAAGIEAPLRIYVTEGKDGTASITWRKPSAVFAPYDVKALDAMAAELDSIFERIVMDAAADD